MANEEEQNLPENVEDVRAYLRDQPLDFALLFGSKETVAVTEVSDVDIVLTFDDTVPEEERFRKRNRIAGELMALLGRDDVDVSMLETLPTEIAHSALQEGVILVGDEEIVDTHRSQVRTTYEETASVRKREREELFHRLKQGNYGR